MALEYEQPRLGHCDFCNFPTMTREYRRQSSVDRKWKKGITKRLCDFCARTDCGTAADYPKQYDGERATLRTLAYATNLLLVAGKECLVHPVWREVNQRGEDINDRMAEEYPDD